VGRRRQAISSTPQAGGLLFHHPRAARCGVIGARVSLSRPAGARQLVSEIGEVIRAGSDQRQVLELGDGFRKQATAAVQALVLRLIADRWEHGRGDRGNCAAMSCADSSRLAANARAPGKRRVLTGFLFFDLRRAPLPLFPALKQTPGTFLAGAPRVAGVDLGVELEVRLARFEIVLDGLQNQPDVVCEEFTLVGRGIGRNQRPVEVMIEPQHHTGRDFGAAGIEVPSEIAALLRQGEGQPIDEALAMQVEKDILQGIAVQNAAEDGMFIAAGARIPQSRDGQETSEDCQGTSQQVFGKFPILSRLDRVLHPSDS